MRAEARARRAEEKARELQDKLANNDSAKEQLKYAFIEVMYICILCTDNVT